MTKKSFIAVILTFFASAVIMFSQSDSKAKYEASFKLFDNDLSGKFFNAEITLKNNSLKDLSDWKLCLNFVRAFKIAPNSNKIVEITKAIGEYNEVKGLVSVPSQSSITFGIIGKFFVKKYTDTPSIYFLVVDGKNIEEVSGSTDMEGYEPPKNMAVPEVADSKISTNNSIRLIPVPSKVELSEGVLDFSTVNEIVDSTYSKDVKKTIRAFLRSFNPLINKAFSVKSKKDLAYGYVLLGTNKDLGTDSYILEITKNSAEIQANSKGGYLYGLISLFKLADSYEGKIPCMKMTDSPRFAYRGALLDTARNFKSLLDVKNYLTMMALYKLNVFHWHLTDDEGWRIEVKKYPNLTTIGSYRGYKEIIPPFDGSSYKKTGGYYSQKDIKDLIRYANSLNITIIPEIDVPGHARALIVSFDKYKDGQNPLVEENDKSKYITPQNFTDDALNPGLDSTYTILEGIFSEVIPLFHNQEQSKMPFANYVHIGSDEVPSGAWLNSPVCKIIMDKNKLKTTQELQHYFVRKVQDIVAKYGCKIAGWEEAAKGGDFPAKDLMVFSWQGQDAGFDAAEKGFPVIMAPAQYLYFDLAYNNDIKEPGFYWAGYVDPKIIYSYDPIPSQSSENVKKNILGVEGCLWGDILVKPRIVNADKLPENFISSPVQYLAFPKMTAYSEVAWSSMNNRNWKKFVGNYKYEKNILDEFDIKYRTAPLE